MQAKAAQYGSKDSDSEKSKHRKYPQPWINRSIPGNQNTRNL